MSCENNSYHQDAHAVLQRHLQGHEQRDQPIEHEVLSVQQEHSDSSSTYLLHQAEQEQECHTGAVTMMLTAPQEQTLASVEEFYLSQLRIQRLQHQIREEKLQHLIKVKELIDKLTTLDETPRKPASLCMIALPTPTPLQPPKVITSASNVTVSDSNSESKSPTTNSSCSLDVELISLQQKLLSQRIEQSIETEEALHKLQLSALK